MQKTTHRDHHTGINLSAAIAQYQEHTATVPSWEGEMVGYERHWLANLLSILKWVRGEEKSRTKVQKSADSLVSSCPTEMERNVSTSQSIIYIFFVAQSPQKASNTEASTPMRKFPSVLQVPNVYLLQYWSRLQTGRSFPLSSGPLRGINQEWKSETAPSHVPTPTAVLEYPHFLQVLVPQTFLNYLLLKGISLLLCKEFLLNLLPFQVFGKAEGSAICQELLGLDTEGNRPWC